MSETVTCRACSKPVDAEEAVSPTAADDDWYHEECYDDYRFLREYEALCRQFSRVVCLVLDNGCIRNEVVEADEYFIDDYLARLRRDSGWRD